MKFVNNILSKLSFLDGIDRTLACPNKFLAAMKAVCIMCVLGCVNLSAVGCSEEKTSTYNPYGESSADDSVVMDSAKTDLRSSGIGSSSVGFREIDSLNKKTEKVTEDKVTVTPVEVQDTIPKKIVDVPSPVHKNPTTISTSQKINKKKGSKKTGDAFRYNLPCEKKVQIKKGMTAYSLCKKYKIDYNELVAINKPGIVENFKINNWVCLKRKE